jgi:hypothetical protein
VAAAAGLGADGGDEVDEEGEDVAGEDEGDGPLQHGGGVVAVLEVGGAEGDGEGDFEEDEGELDAEGDAEDAVLAEICARGEFVCACVCLRGGERVEGGGKGRVRIPRRWYSQQMQTAEKT